MRKVQDTRNIVHRAMTPQSPSKSAPWALYNSPNRHQPPHCIFLNLIDGLKSLPFQRWFYFWEKPKVSGHQIWALGELSHLGDLMFTKKLCRRRDAWARARCCDEAANHPLPIAAAFWIIWIVPVEECSSLTQNLMQISCSTCSVI